MTVSLLSRDVEDRYVAAGTSSFAKLFAKRAAAKYDISARDILVELGRRGMVGGQEDMIEDTALTLAKARGVSLARAA